MNSELERMPFQEVQQHEDALRLGHILGVTLMDRVKDQVAEMSEEQRVVFFSALLKAPVGCIRAAVGQEAALGILDAAKEYVTNG